MNEEWVYFLVMVQFSDQKNTIIVEIGVTEKSRHYVPGNRFQGEWYFPTSLWGSRRGCRRLLPNIIRVFSLWDTNKSSDGKSGIKFVTQAALNADLNCLDLGLFISLKRDFEGWLHMSICWLNNGKRHNCLWALWSVGSELCLEYSIPGVKSYLASQMWHCLQESVPRPKNGRFQSTFSLT